MTKPLLSIIIVNFNTFKLTCDCLKSIYDTSKNLDFEIILVDNASKECDPKEFIKNFPDVKLIENKDNVGFGVANNQGMAVAVGDFFILLNSDTIVLDNALEMSVTQLQKRMQNYDTAKIAILGCEVMNPDHTHQISYWTFDDSSIWDAFRQARIYSVVYGKISSLLSRPKSADNDDNAPRPEKAGDKPFLVNGLYGAFMLIHRKVYDETGGFDPDFFLYCEETEWFRNRIKKKYLTEYYPDAKIIHLGGSSGAHLNKFSNQRQASAFLYWYKRGLAMYWVFVLVVYFCIITNLLLYPFLSKYSKSQIWALFSIIPIAFWEIPRYSRKFGSRKRFLRLD